MVPSSSSSLKISLFRKSTVRPVFIFNPKSGSVFLYLFNFIPHRKYTNKDFGIEDYISKTDKDGDGIDDQTDILENVRKYIATKPKYKSKYYNTGYPNDEYGVCTDVVGFGLLGAGYNLQELVNADIVEHQSQYNIEKIDKNIDFRRVRNLKIYFDNNNIGCSVFAAVFCVCVGYRNYR